MNNYNALLFTPKNKPEAEYRLVCFPYAGGNASSYIHWQHSLSNNIELTVIQLPGRSVRLAEKPYSTMKEIVINVFNDLQKLSKKSLIFYGHSMGARVAYEVAIMLHRHQLQLPTHFIASGSATPRRKAVENFIHTLPDQEFIAKLGNINGAKTSALKNEELMQMALPSLRADFKIIETYTNPQQGRIPGKISVLAGKHDSIANEHYEDWLNLFDNTSGIHIIEGDHFFIDTNSRDVLSFIHTLVVEREIFSI